MRKNYTPLIGAALLALAPGCVEARADAPEPFQGTVELDEVALGFDVGGRVARVDVKEGDTLVDGRVVAALDDTLVRLSRDVRRAELGAAQAQLRLAEAGSRVEEVRATQAELDAARAEEALVLRVLERQRALVAGGAAADASLDDLSGQKARTEGRRRALAEKLAAQRAGARPEELDVARARVTASETALAAEEERLVRFALKAPRAGAVIDVHVEPGEVVGAGSPVVTLADVEHPYVDVFVPQGRTEGIVAGMAATIRVDARSEPLAGHVEHVGRRMEFTPRFLFSDKERPNLVLRVRVRIEGHGGDVPAGVPAFVTLGPRP